MTRSVYVIGGAGAGKSTFMNQLMDATVMYVGPLSDVWSKPNAGGKSVTLRGHEISTYGGTMGLYLGFVREKHPGTDGLDRASSLPGSAWLTEAPELPGLIIGEGATLATRPFLHSLFLNTESLVMHLTVDPLLADVRFAQRGSTQSDQFVRNTVTRSANLARELAACGAAVWELDSGDDEQWSEGLDIAVNHLLPEGVARSPHRE